MKLTNTKIDLVSACLPVIKNRGLSVASLKATLKLRARLTSLMEEARELRIALMDKYEIKPEKGSYNYDKHARLTEILADLAEIAKAEVEVEGLNYMTFEELHAASEGADNDVLAVLMEYIVKE